MTDGERTFWIWVACVGGFTLITVVRTVVNGFLAARRLRYEREQVDWSRGYGPAIAEPACPHQWEKDGERVEKEIYEENSGDMVTTPFQPCRCAKCGEMRSFEL